jgi:hypothetical protein
MAFAMQNDDTGFTPSLTVFNRDDGIDNEGDGLIDFDGGASHNGGVPLTAPDPRASPNRGATRRLPAAASAPKWRCSSGHCC